MRFGKKKGEKWVSPRWTEPQKKKKKKLEKMVAFFPGGWIQNRRAAYRAIRGKAKKQHSTAQDRQDRNEKYLRNERTVKRKEWVIEQIRGSQIRLEGSKK